MSVFSGSFRGRSFAALIVVLATASDRARAHAGAESSPVDNVRIPDPASAWALRRALKGATRYLEQPECQRVFSEFTDTAGRPLQEGLDSQAKTGPAFLGSLIFYDGAHLARCRLKRTYAVASPGSRIVFLCSSQFQEIVGRKLPLARVILIHEALHALGLGEDPPTSAEITNRVMSRCLP